MAGNLKKSDYVVFWGMCLGYVLFGLVLLSAFTRFHVIRSRYVNASIISYFYQVRWNVYVKKVDDPLYHLYTIENNKAKLWDLRSFVGGYWFGLKRDYKTIAQEVLTITNDTATLKNLRTYKVDVPAGKDLNDCLSLDTLQFNDVPHKNSILLKGKYLIVSEEPMDWDKARMKPPASKTLVVLPVNVSRK
jgi:hypothetical protein